MTTVNLTELVVERAKPAARDVILWDARTRGFGLKVTPGGRKLYLLKYRLAGGRAGQVRKPRIGDAQSMTLKEARAIADDWLAAVRRGGDPSGQRQAFRMAPNVDALCDRYLAEHVALHNKASTQREFKRVVERDIRPKLGKRKVAEISRRDALELQQAHRARPYQANRILAILSKMFSLAEVWELRPMDSNPCRRIQRQKEAKRERFLAADELARLGAALAAAEAAGRLRAGTLAGVRLLALTGCRLSEILTLRWSDVDLARGLLSLREENAKAGARVVPLGRAAVALLEQLQVEGREFVLEDAAGWRPSVNVMEHAWGVLREAAKLTNARLHDLRHTVGTYAGGFSAFVVRDLLGHKTLAMTGRYVERDVSPVQAAADSVSARIAAALAGVDSNVVPMRRRARAAGKKTRA